MTERVEVVRSRGRRRPGTSTRPGPSAFRCRVLGWVSGVALVCSLAAPSSWAAPREWRVAADLGPGLFAGEAPSAPAMVAGATAWYGITEAVWLTGSLQTGYVAETSAQTGNGLVEAQLGVVAALDILRFVPFGELTVGGTGRTDLDRWVPGPRLGLGFEYLLDPTWSVGAVFRGRPLWDGGPEIVLLSGQVQVGARFGF